MKIVENVSLAHVRFLSTAPKTTDTPDSLSFEGFIGFLMTYNDKTNSSGLETLPFILAQSSLTPYILIAATTEAGGLAEYLKNPQSPELQEAINCATETCWTMGVPDLLKAVLSFFDKFAPWFTTIRDYLSMNGASQVVT